MLSARGPHHDARQMPSLSCGTAGTAELPNGHNWDSVGSVPTDSTGITHHVALVRPQASFMKNELKEVVLKAHLNTRMLRPFCAL